MIITDDAGWADYGFMRDAISAADPGGAGVVPTPNLDRLADDGVTYTNAYTGSVCAPSRAMITTGQYGNRFGFVTNTGSDTSAINSVAITQGLPTSITTVWERMQTVGYDTAAVGKWHLGAHADGGGQLGNRPENQGIEHFQGMWSGSRNYFGGNESSNTNVLRKTISDGAGSVSSNVVEESIYNGQYVTDVFGDQSVDYIRDKTANDSDPFFLYTSFTAPHTPMQAIPSDLAFIDSLNEPGFTGNRRTYAAMQYAMDRNVGKILDAIEDPNNDGDTSDSIAEDTLILFINDNGGDCCDSGPNSSDNGDLRNGKGSQFEGGMRVPMIVAGGGVNVAARGTVSADLVHSVDLVPTAFVGAGGGVLGGSEVIDGANLLPYINGQMAGVAHEDLFISRYSNQQSAVRKGPWKYMYQNNASGYQLYNLDTDLDESNNVVNDPSNAATVEEMHQLLASYHVQMDKPRVDNNAPSTNQFDNFRFREGAFTNAAFSSANAWENEDSPGGTATAGWRDGYANNRMTFRAKASGSYTITNDLSSVGGFGYMANRLTLASATAALSGSETATINGLPILMTNDLSGSGPTINVDANDASPGQFTFDVQTTIEIYDDLVIQGNGNQNFHFNGQIKEFRPGRNLTKTGTADVTFGGGVDVSGTVDLQGGKVTFNQGDVSGNLIARTGVTIQVGPNGIIPGNPGVDPLEIFTTGIDLNFDAAQDLSGDSLWNDSAGTPNNLNFSSTAAVNNVNSTEFPFLSAAYEIPVSGGATGLSDYYESSNPRSRQDGTFEVVFNVTDDSAGNDQVIFEVGGTGRGVAMVLNNGMLTFNVDGDGSDVNLTTAVSEGWHHAVGVVDLTSGADSISLYLNNQFIGTMSGQNINDWAGGNPMGIGDVSSVTTGVSGTAQPFHGEIAVMRYYRDTTFGSTEVDQNYQWLLQDAIDPTGQPEVVLAVQGDFTLESNTNLEIDILDESKLDQVAATGALLLDGSLMVSASSGFAPTLGASYLIATGSSVNGEFSATSLPVLPAGMMWQVLYGTNEVNLLVTVSGDYNGDGMVDAADYTVWRDTLGQTVSAGVAADGNGDGVITNDDLAVWQANYGMSVSSSFGVVSVPEPTAAITTAIGSLLLTANSWRNFK